MTITKEWLEDNATGKIGWTYMQVRCLGVSWPLRKGWKSKLIGKQISDETAREFERLGARRRQQLARQLIENEPALF